MSHPDDNLDDLEAALRVEVEDIAEALLGPANRKLSNRKELAFGNKGSLKVVLSGQKRGLWHDHEAGLGGGPLRLVLHGLRCSWAEAIAWARIRTGQSAVSTYTMPTPRPERLIEQAAKAAKAATEAATDEARRIGNARRLWQSSVPVMGPAAAYLIETRMIPAPVMGWPSEAVRFHKSSNSLILAATTADGVVQAVQRVCLTHAGRKIDAAEVKARRLPAVKFTDGPMAGAYIRLPGDPNGPIQLAEGPETGLTVWRATGHETWIALGGIARIEPPAGRRIIVCADDDLRHAQAGKSNNTHKSRMEAVARWRAEGREVQLLYPWPVRRGDKSDFNDLVQARGIGAVRDRINLALNPLAGLPGRVPVQETRDALIGLVERFFAAALAWVPPAKDEEGPSPLVVATDPGVAAGKSSAAHRYAVDLIRKLRAAGDHRTVAIATPTHALNIEQAKRIKALAGASGLVVEVWHARARPDPGQIDKAMCWDLDAIADAKAAGENPQDAVCGSGPTQCQFAGECGYQKQRKNTADIWLVSHELLFARKPRALGTLAALIIDEGFLKAGIYGIDAKDEHALTVDSLRGNLEIPGERASSTAINGLKRSQGEPEVDDRSDVLNRARYKRLVAIDGAPDGWLLRSRLISAGLTANEATTARALTKKLLVDSGILPGMDEADRKAAVEAARGNGTIKKDMMLWAAIAEQLLQDGQEQSGHATLGKGRTEHGNARLVRLKGRKHVRAGWRVPTLIIDATLKIEVVTRFFPHVQNEPTPPSAAPFQRITQVIDKAFAASGLVVVASQRKKAAIATADGPLSTSKEAQRCANRLAEVRAWIILQARKVAPGEVLVVLQKAVEIALLEMGPLPANTRTGHHNALRGSNEFEHVRLLIIVGRTQPTPPAVERMAEALSGAGVEPIAGYYAQADAIRETAEGKAELTGTERHPDPLAEAIRWQICEGELIQLVGRGRGVNRTAADPLEVFLLTDIPLPLPIARRITAAELKLTIAEAQLAAGGVAYEVPADAVLAYPDMWVRRDGQPSIDAARKAFQRDARESRCGTFPNIKDLLIGECPTPQSWRYQRAGPGHHPATVTIDRSVIPDPEAHMTATLGELEFCRLANAEIKAGADMTLADVAAIIPALEVAPMVQPIAARPIPAPGAYEAWVALPPCPPAHDEEVPPDAIYRRGVLEIPPADMLTVRGEKRMQLAEIEVPAMGPYLGMTRTRRVPGPRPMRLYARPEAFGPGPGHFARRYACLNAFHNSARDFYAFGADDGRGRHKGSQQ